MSKQTNKAVSTHARDIMSQTGMKYTEALREAQRLTHIPYYKGIDTGKNRYNTSDGRLASALNWLPLVSQLNPVTFEGRDVQWEVSGYGPGMGQVIELAPSAQFEPGYAGSTSNNSTLLTLGSMGFLQWKANEDDSIDYPDGEWQDMIAMDYYGKTSKQDERLYEVLNPEFIGADDRVKNSDGVYENATIENCTAVWFGTYDYEKFYLVDLRGLTPAEKIKLASKYINKYTGVK